MRIVALINVGFGLSTWLLATFQFMLLMSFSYRVTARIRVAYLRAILT
jgi:hypothetical protein